MNTMDQCDRSAPYCLGHCLGRLSWLGLLSSVLLVGCVPVSSPTTIPLSENGAQYLLQQEPADPVGVDAAFAQLTSEGDTSEMTLVGRIPRQVSPGVAPWGEKEATFVVVETTQDENADHARPGHDPDNCPFCRRRAAEGKPPVNSLAMIQIVDDQGKIVSSDVRQLLGLKENQVVVARGQAHRDPLGNIILSTQGVFVRSSE